MLPLFAISVPTCRTVKTAAPTSGSLLYTAEIKATLDLIHRQHTFHRLPSVPPARSIEQHKVVEVARSRHRVLRRVPS